MVERSFIQQHVVVSEWWALQDTRSRQAFKGVSFMSYISPTNLGAASNVGRTQSGQVSRPDAAENDTRQRPARSKDQVEFSNVARYLSDLKAGPAERSELIAQIRQEIDAGNYDTPEKLDAAIDGVIEDLEFEL